MGISVPSYSFAPNVAGKYYVFGQVFVNATGANNIHRAISYILKNNASIATADVGVNSSYAGELFSPRVAIITELNGTSDYVHLQGYGDATSGTMRFKGDSTEARTYFGAYRIGD